MLEIAEWGTGVAAICAAAAVILAGECRPWPLKARVAAVILCLSVTAGAAESGILVAQNLPQPILMQVMVVPTTNIAVLSCALGLEDWLRERWTYSEGKALLLGLTLLVCLNGASVDWWLRGPAAIWVGIAMGAILGTLIGRRQRLRGWSRRRSAVSGVVVVAVWASMAASAAGVITEIQMSLLAVVGLGAHAALRELSGARRRTETATGNDWAESWLPWIAMIWVVAPIPFGVITGLRASIIAALTVTALLIPALWKRALIRPTVVDVVANRVRVFPLPAGPLLRLPGGVVRYRDLRRTKLYAHQVPDGILLSHRPERPNGSNL